MSVAQWPALIRQFAAQYGVDPKAALAVASMEGLSGRVGDGGHAFGPFQMNDAGGVLTHRPGNHQAYAESAQGIRDAIMAMANSGARGKTGAAAIQAIVHNYERPKAPGPEIRGAISHYGNSGSAAPNGVGPVTFPPTSDGSGGLGPLRPANSGNLFNQLAAMTMLQSAQNTVKGQVDASPLMQLALTRQQMGAANQTFGPMPQLSHGQGGPTAKVRALDGSFHMQTGGKSPYSNLRFGKDVDWIHVNPRLLKAVNSAAAGHGVVVDVNSGYRSNQHSLQVGGFAGDPHTKGHAIDAYVNGKPIGTVIGPGLWSKLGVQSGAVPNFYQGKSDPEHLQI